MKKRKLIAISSVLAVVLLVSTFAAITMQSKSLGTSEPANMADLVNYPGVVETRDLDPTEIDTEIVSMDLTGTVGGIPVEGIDDLKLRLTEKGLMPNGQWFVDSFFDVFVSIQVWSPDGTEVLQGYAWKGWTNTMLPDGSKALIAGCVLQDPITLQNYSMIMGVPTNVLPPEQMPGIDPYIIWNAEPYWYIQHYWWYWGIPGVVPGRLVYWKYWWYDSHKGPNWFWGTYWWWRTYIYDYVGYYQWWYWWWWSWYYWRGWYFWSTLWPYY